MAAIWRSHGFDVRRLEGEGDHTFSVPLAATDVDRPFSARIHSEVKRQNRLRTAWLNQAEREAPAGAVPVVAWRPDGGKWWAMIPLEDLVRLLA